MQRLSIPPNTVTLVCCLEACRNIRATLASNENHKDIVQKVVERDYFIGNTLVHMYAKHGSLDKMLSVQEQVSWNAPIVGYAENGEN